jgi:hypothetical protein
MDKPLPPGWKAVTAWLVTTDPAANAEFMIIMELDCRGCQAAPGTSVDRFMVRRRVDRHGRHGGSSGGSGEAGSETNATPPSKTANRRARAAWSVQTEITARSPATGG